MDNTQGNGINRKWIGLVAVLFGLLLVASHGNELLKQIVITPGTAAELGIAADCRADELEEEGLSLQECQLMVSNVQIVLASSPSWFRPLMLGLASGGLMLAVVSMFAGFSLVNDRPLPAIMLKSCFVGLLLIDLLIFVAATNTGPLLRAQYLWYTLLWFFIHMSLLAAVFSIENDKGKEAS